jgi:hypothetical protein
MKSGHNTWVRSVIGFQRLQYAFDVLLAVVLTQDVSFHPKRHQTTDQYSSLMACERCRRLFASTPIIYRREVIFGDVERRMAANPPTGYTFVGCNWKSEGRQFGRQVEVCEL